MERGEWTRGCVWVVSGQWFFHASESVSFKRSWLISSTGHSGEQHPLHNPPFLAMRTKKPSRLQIRPSWMLPIYFYHRKLASSSLNKDVTRTCWKLPPSVALKKHPRKGFRTHEERIHVGFVDRAAFSWGCDGGVFSKDNWFYTPRK